MQSKIASLPASSENYDKDIDNIYAELEGFREELDNVLIEVSDMLAAWEETQQVAQEEAAELITTEWELDAWIDYVIPQGKVGDVSVEVKSRSIDDEDNYTITLVITNTYDVIIQPASITLTFRPDDKVAVSDDVDIYSSASPNLDWNVDILRTTDKLCKKIQAVADIPTGRLTIPAQIDTIPGTVQCKVEFDLVY